MIHIIFWREKKEEKNMNQLGQKLRQWFCFCLLFYVLTWTNHKLDRKITKRINVVCGYRNKMVSIWTTYEITSFDDNFQWHSLCIYIENVPSSHLSRFICRIVCYWISWWTTDGFISCNVCLCIPNNNNKKRI